MATAPASKAVNIGIKNLGEYVNDAYRLSLEAHNSELECRATINIYDVNNSIPPTELISILHKHKITEAIDLEQIALFCAEAAHGANQESILLASGFEPIHGTDGWFELIVTTGKEKADLTEDQSGRVDFKSIQNFSNVESGQQIGNIYLPTAGKPGKTITGEPILPRSGKPSRVVAGAGVRVSDDGTQAIADQAGRVVFENNILSISEEFVVNGDVDLSIGHIRFNGFVDIKGDVLDDFNITATKGINVVGAVGACQISADGPVTIGSMAGLGRGKVTCEGSFQARYLNQAIIECWGDIHITNESRNSSIKATGSINVPNGLIAGGEVVAMEGIEAKIFGTRSGAATRLTAGVYFPETDRLNYLRYQLKSVIGQLKNISKTLASLNNKPLSTQRKALREALELRIGILTQRNVNLESEREDVAEELQQFTADDHPTANPKINALGAIKDNVTLGLGEVKEEIPTDISGPVSIIENVDQGGFRYLIYSALQVAANDLEEEELLQA